MRHTNISKKRTHAIVVTAFVLSGVVASLLAYSLTSRGISAFPYSPPSPPIVQATLDGSVATTADQAFLFIVPIAVVFLVYIGYMLNVLARNANKGTASGQVRNISYHRKYFQ